MLSNNTVVVVYSVKDYMGCHVCLFSKAESTREASFTDDIRLDLSAGCLPCLASTTTHTCQTVSLVQSQQP